MLHNTNTMRGFAVHATDASVGRLSDILFYDDTWEVSYLVVDTGPWVFGRRLLCSPGYITSVEETEKETTGRIEIELTRSQIQDSPDEEEDLPVSELKAREFEKYEKGPVFWSGSGERKEGKPPGAMPAMDEHAEREKQDVELALYGKHLRSAAEVEGYTARASDRDLGTVTGLLVDPDAWLVRYFVVTAGRKPRSLQVYSPDWIQDIRWIERSVHLEFSYEVAANAPPLSEHALVTREYEKKLYDYYELEA